ncbi:MAG TPA: cupredoxin domain-containing protein [Acidimicrobiia bacterium]|nr:cupredoxin domain-containing protein [Acidimicrobiia bacterium]
MPDETRTHRLPTVVLALVVPVVALLAVIVTLDATSAPGGSSATAAAGNGTSITIKDFNFSPKPLRVKAGTALTVTNADDTDHTVTAADGAFDTGTLGGGKTATITVDAPGTYRYFCDIHNYMTGTIEAT